MRSRLDSGHGRDHKYHTCESSLADCDKYFTSFAQNRDVEVIYAACKVMNTEKGKACAAAAAGRKKSEGFGAERCDNRVPAVAAKIERDMEEARQPCTESMCNIAKKGKWMMFGRKKAIEQKWPRTSSSPLGTGWFNTMQQSRKCIRPILTTFGGGRGS